VGCPPVGLGATGTSRSARSPGRTAARS